MSILLVWFWIEYFFLPLYPDVFFDILSYIYMLILENMYSLFSHLFMFLQLRNIYKSS